MGSPVRQEEAALAKLVGDELCASDGSTMSTRHLFGEGRVIGLFFSAQWCAPCRAFTPDLVAFYRNFKAGHEAADRLEMVFVSSDEDQQAFERYSATMPWPAIPFADKDTKIRLTRKFHVRNIPSLVLIDGITGDVITDRGRDHVLDDPRGSHFPWRPRDPVDVLREVKLVNNRGETVDFGSLDGHFKGIYFSAHWCPPCKAFTPHLSETYRKLRQSGRKLEIIFVSSDRSEDSFRLYFAAMPWLALPYDHEKQRKELALLYGVEGIPTLVILDENNAVVTKDGRLEVNDDPDGEFFPWHPKAVDELTDRHALKLNEDPCLILLTEGDDKELDRAYNVLRPVAEEFKRRNADTVPLHFFYGGEAEICDTLRELMNVEEDQVPLLAIVDVQAGKRFVLEAADEDADATKPDITCDVVRAFLADYLDGKLKPKPLNT